MGILISLGLIILSSVVIFYVGQRFAEASSYIGDYIGLPRDVKGATFDAISSSMPELMVALFSVIFFRQFEIGIGTIAGSALFNLLVIPGICVFVAPVAFKVSKKVITRDAWFYLVSVFILLVLLIYVKTWGLVVAMLLLFAYLLYIKDIISHTKTHLRRHSHKHTRTEELSVIRETANFIILLIIMGAFTFILTKSSVDLSNALGVHPIIIAFTVIAAATSVPDGVISITNARKGSIDDAASNVFASNIFDIFVGIGLPLLIYFIYKGAVGITFTNIEIVLGLMGTSIILLYFFADSHKLTRRQAAILLLLYLAFVGYTIFLAATQ